MARTLLLLRHAEAAGGPPGGRDTDRPLTARGQRQAAAVGAWLADSALRVDAVVCSPALRARQTASGVGLDVVPVLTPMVYEATPADILATLAELPDAVAAARVLLVVGHAPGIPGLALELADPYTSDAHALAAVEQGFPTAALARLETEDLWAALVTATLTAVHAAR